MQVHELIAEHTKEWSAMVSQQLLEEHQMLKTNIGQQNEILSSLMTDYQDTRLKELQLRHDRCLHCHAAKMSIIF